MKKIFMSMIIILMFFVSVAFSAPTKTYNVKSNNTNNKGYIFIGTGTQQGATQIGTFVNIKDVPELKGEKGDQGIAGLNGIDGLDGIDGFDGYTPIKGVDYFDGLNGVDGKDVDPATVTALQTTDVQLQNNIVAEKAERLVTNNQLNRRINDTNNKINDVSNRVSELERTQYVLESVFRIVDTKRIEIAPFVRQNFTRNKVDVVGARVTIKIGESYEEKLIRKINQRLDMIEKRLGNAPIMEKIIDQKGNVISLIISETGNMALRKEF